MLHKNLELVLNETYREAQIRDHAFITAEHLLYAILESFEGMNIIESSGGDADAVREELNDYLNTLEKVKNNNEAPLQTLSFQRILQRAIMHVQNAEKPEVEIGDIIVALYDEEENEASYFLKKYGVERLAILECISDLSAENASPANDETGSLNQQEQESYLSKYAFEMTEMARQNKYDTVIGRENEISRTIEILCRRQKNNPVFVGDPGVGKTAIVQGLARRIADDEVPDRLKNYSIYSLDIGLLVAGTKYRGDFEKRIKELLAEVKKNKKAILFIDELHTIVGAGSVGGGSLDASNILKPLLTGGEIRCIGATTFEEYRRYIEKDRALSRRLQKIDVPEPDVADSVKILHGLKGRYEEFHGVKYSSASIQACVDLSALYIRDRFLPDKAIDLMDETGASVSIYRDKKNISKQDIIHTLSRMTGISVHKMGASDIQSLQLLPEKLKNRIFGQDKAIHSLVTVIKKHFAGLNRPDKPVGSFLFAGPTGVGKTELCRALAEELGQDLIRFDMSEYSEKQTISRLLGSPPGYVGFDQGALLTDAVRKKPNAVILLDEIEKADPDIYNVLLQIFDRAVVTDNTGKNADFRSNIIIMTSNAGSREMSSLKIGFTEGMAQYGDSLREIKRVFSPEFLNRLDEIILFEHLTNELALKIIHKSMNQLKSHLQSKNIVLEVSDSLLQYLLKNGFDPVNGARPLETLLEKEVKSLVVDEILSGTLIKGGKLFADYKNLKVVISEM
ncbi:MAG: AAA family ATPase [Spirochaetia bacterium]|nr:AAA family ATPase [Spirochaetia bacterium]